MLKQPPVEPPVQNQVKVEPGLWSRSVAQFHGTDDDSDDYYDSPEFKQKEDKLHRELTGWRYHPVEENEVLLYTALASIISSLRVASRESHVDNSSNSLLLLSRYTEKT